MSSPDSDPNSEPLNRDRQYDEFVKLLALHDQAIRRFIRCLMPTRDGVDDVLQETVLECWKKYDDFQRQASTNVAEEFVRWGCVIARYKALSWQRDRSRDRLVFRDQLIEQLSDSAGRIVEDRQAEREAIESCLDSLPVAHRELVLSAHSPGESIADIARKTGAKARQLYRKVNSLRAALQRCVDGRLQEELNRG